MARGKLGMTQASRRNWLFGAAGLGAGALFSSPAAAFGEEGAFHARLLSLGKEEREDDLSAARRWAWELTRRSSAPGKLAAELVRPESSDLLEEPFTVWAGDTDPGKLSSQALRGLRQYLRMGGVLVVDERSKTKDRVTFTEGVKRELRRVLPESGIVQLPEQHVVFKSYYILDEPMGRRPGPDHIEAIVRGGMAQVLFLNHDLLGALARRGDNWAHPMEVSSATAREQALRFAVNIAMYVLCSDYKDDQVHAPFLMRRRLKRR